MKNTYMVIEHNYNTVWFFGAQFEKSTDSRTQGNWYQTDKSTWTYRARTFYFMMIELEPFFSYKAKSITNLSLLLITLWFSSVQWPRIR